jgi:hypothetical protein
MARSSTMPTQSHSACPVVSVVSRVRYLRLHSALSDAPCAPFAVPVQCLVHRVLRLKAIRTSATILGLAGFNADDVSARSCRAGGAMAPYVAVSTQSIIQLVGRWRSMSCFAISISKLVPSLSNLSAQCSRQARSTLSRSRRSRRAAPLSSVPCLRRVELCSPGAHCSSNFPPATLAQAGPASLSFYWALSPGSWGGS